VNEFLDELWTFFDREVQISSRPKLLAVPGNHDLVRPQGTQDPNDQVFHDWISNFWEQDSRNIKHFWNNSTFRPRQIISESFANYEDWWEKQKYRPTDIKKGIIPGDFSFSCEKEGAKLGILGLNTSFLQLTDDDYQGKLNLDVRQFHQACNNNGPNWTREHHICMLLTHHPPGWLHDKSQTQFKEEIINNNNFAVHLCGHLHEASYREYAEGGTEAHRTWQGRSLFGIEYYDHRQRKSIERLHGYTLGQINFNRQDKAKLIFCPREVRKQGHNRNFIPDFFCKLDEETLLTDPQEITLLKQYAIAEENVNGSQDISRGNYQELVKTIVPQYQEQKEWKDIHEKLQLFCKKLGSIDQAIYGFTLIEHPNSSEVCYIIEDLIKEVERRKEEIEKIKIEDLKTPSVRDTINRNLESTNWLTNIKELIDKIFREINKFSATDNEDTTNENERNSLTIKNYTSNLKNKLIYIIRNECLLQLQNQSNAFLAFIDTELKTSMDLFEQKLRKLEKDYESIK
ncbi:metallophosphoesterase family protein, partial [Microcystis aeruginosa]|uniref:metallophosphoesterase family protein n=1 Tax=Microcystis aeruginosa TaxID=1126 RepID=UPI001655D7F9